MTTYMTPEQLRAEGKGKADEHRFVPPYDEDVIWDMTWFEDDATKGVVLAVLFITLPCLPPSKNKWDRSPNTKPMSGKQIQAMRRQAWYDPWHNWFAGRYAMLRRKARAAVTFGKQKVQVEITFHFPDERNRDTVQNYAGYPPLMDALTNKHTGIIHDDGRKWCRLVVNPDAVIDGTRQTVIRITPLDGEKE